jgi:hypothetical protein
MSIVHRWQAFTVLAVSYFMTIVDLTIVNVALRGQGVDAALTSGFQRALWICTAIAALGVLAALSVRGIAEPLVVELTEPWELGSATGVEVGGV